MQHDLSGLTLGQYRIDQIIGRGGMATVYRAQQSSLGRNVAVKVLPAYFAQDADFVARFRREARAVAQLDHPNILPVFDFGEQDGITFIVMPLVAGGTLKDRTGPPLPLAWCARMCGQVAQALAYAHERGIIHRDVKPSNILLGPADWPLLADFGIARMVGETGMLTQHGVGIGTPEYMSPEQGHGLAVDGRTDQYALAMMAFELLTGRTAFQGETPIATIMKQISDPVPSLRAYNPDLSRAVDDIVQRGLAKRAEDRFATILEFAEALQRCVPSGAERTATVTTSPAILYQDLQRAMRDSDWETALAIGARILAINPMYEDVADLFSRCRQEVGAKREREAQVAHLLTGARYALADGRFADAESAIGETLDIAPGHPQALQMQAAVRAHREPLVEDLAAHEREQGSVSGGTVAMATRGPTPGAREVIPSSPATANAEQPRTGPSDGPTRGGTLAAQATVRSDPPLSRRPARAVVAAGIVLFALLVGVGSWRALSSAGSDPPPTPGPAAALVVPLSVVGTPTPDPTPSATPLPTACLDTTVAFAAADAALAAGRLDFGQDTLEAVIDCPGVSKNAVAQRLDGVKALASARDQQAAGDLLGAVIVLRSLGVSDPSFPGLVPHLVGALLASGRAALAASALDEAMAYCGEALLWAPAESAAMQCLVDAVPPTPLPTATAIPPTPTRPPAAPPPAIVVATPVPQAQPLPVPSATLRPPPVAVPTATLRPPPGL